MDQKTLVKSAIKHQIKAGHFEALSQGISATEYRQIVIEALDDLDGEKLVPDKPVKGFSTAQDDLPGHNIISREPPEDDIVSIG